MAVQAEAIETCNFAGEHVMSIQLVLVNGPIPSRLCVSSCQDLAVLTCIMEKGPKVVIKVVNLLSWDCVAVIEMNQNTRDVLAFHYDEHNYYIFTGHYKDVLLR